MLIGREKEKQVLHNALNEEYSQFIAVYGRRRVGKTFLICQNRSRSGMDGHLQERTLFLLYAEAVPHGWSKK